MEALDLKRQMRVRTSSPNAVAFRLAKLRYNRKTKAILRNEIIEKLGPAAGATFIRRDVSIYALPTSREL
jgi:hypothetical protein